MKITFGKKVIEPGIQFKNLNRIDMDVPQILDHLMNPVIHHHDSSISATEQKNIAGRVGGDT